MHGQSDKMDAEEMESMLKNLLDSGRRGKVTEGRLQSLSMIEPDELCRSGVDSKKLLGSAEKCSENCKKESEKIKKKVRPSYGKREC